jgi:aryl-alcohol dehydrogenase-like predicted oxidoreductase
MENRRLGRTDIFVSPIALGCWPISGMTSLQVTEANSIATLEAAVDEGINHFDTAYAYGAAGESERLIARALGQHRNEIVIATKGGIAWSGDGNRIVDARPATLRRQCEESLLRLDTDRVELLYLHAPDPGTPVAESAGGLKQLLDEGKVRSVGASNLSLEQLEEFAAECPLTAIQPNYNMLQREIEDAIVPWCIAHEVSILVYWPLLKGLLAGKLARDHVFEARDGRRKYSQFQGEQWQRNQDLLDELRPIAKQAGRTLAQLVINWTTQQPGITSALCGAKRPDQLQENAGAMGWRLDDDVYNAIDEALQRRDKPDEMKAI